MKRRRPNSSTGVGQQPKKKRKLTLRKGSNTNDETKFTTITTSLSNAIGENFREVLLEYVEHFSQLTVLANLVSTKAALKLIGDPQVPVETLKLLFNQTFFNRCSQITSTSKTIHKSLQIDSSRDTPETCTVKRAINESSGWCLE